VLLPAFAERDTRLDEAAALLGASPARIAWRVHLPLLAAPLAAAAGLAAAASLGDFGASVLVTRPDNMPLSVWIGRHDAPFNPLLKAQAIALAGLLAALSGAVYLAVQRRLTF
jgi:thiamine transport system permease protein